MTFWAFNQSLEHGPKFAPYLGALSNITTTSANGYLTLGLYLQLFLISAAVVYS